MPTSEPKSPSAPSASASNDEVTRLREENARLKRELAEAKPEKEKPHVPKWLPEGTREELERNGQAVNPFTGEKLTKK